MSPRCSESLLKHRDFALLLTEAENSKNKIFKLQAIWPELDYGKGKRGLFRFSVEWGG
jgi:hypothetical protein